MLAFERLDVYVCVRVRGKGGGGRVEIGDMHTLNFSVTLYRVYTADLYWHGSE